MVENCSDASWGGAIAFWAVMIPLVIVIWAMVAGMLMVGWRIFVNPGMDDGKIR